MGLCTAAHAGTPVVVNGTVYELQGLVGIGRMAAKLRDEHSETPGSISGLAADLATRQRIGADSRHPAPQAEGTATTAAKEVFSDGSHVRLHHSAV
jgi:hypothetical protein